MLVEETTTLDEQIETRLEKIAELKEALRAGATNVNGEMRLLGELSREINALRDLREARFLRRKVQHRPEIAPVYVDTRESVSRPHGRLM